MGSDKWQWRGGIILIFLVSYKNQSLFEVSRGTLFFPQTSFREMTLLSSSVCPSSELTYTVIWKKSLLIRFESHLVSPILTGRVLIVTLQHFVNS